MKSGPRFCLAVALLSCGVCSSHCDTITAACTADTTLFETSPDSNFGGDTTLVAGTTAQGLRSRAVVKFDLVGQVPLGATITSATLQIQVVKASSIAANNSVFEVRRLLENWGEGTGTGQSSSPANTGEATWKARFFPNTFWAAPGGGEGIDYSSIVSSSTPISGLGAYTFDSNTNLVADVQSWVDRPTLNFGWMLRIQTESTTGTARRLASREAAANLPSLTINYSPPPPAFRIVSFVLDAASGTLIWSGGRGPFQLQTTASLNPANWSDLGPSIPSGLNRTTLSTSANQAFYRLRAAGP